VQSLIAATVPTFADRSGLPHQESSLMVARVQGEASRWRRSNTHLVLKVLCSQRNKQLLPSDITAEAWRKETPPLRT